MNKHDDCPGCREYHQLSRRHFLGLVGGYAAAVATPAWLPRVVLAEDHQSDRDVLVSIFLRGGADGLSLVVPHGETRYYDLRPTLAVAPPDSLAENRAADLDGFFGLPPAMTPLLDAYRDGALALVHACGLEDATRSHFSAQHFMEVGTGNPAGLTSGWLGRHLASTAPSLADGLLRAVGIGAGLPRLLVGAPKTLPIADPENFGFGGNQASEAARREAITAMYAAGEGLLERAARDTLGTVDLLQQIDFAGYQPAGGAVYPENSDFGQALAATAALIKADVGVEAVAIDVGGWDTHQLQDPVGGAMATVMSSLAGGLAAFHRDLDASGRSDVLTVAMSEFGRNAFENGSAGTDHGHGGVMLVLGEHVAGGRVITEWPGLGEGQLFDDQDLAITIDYRDVLSEILTKRLANPDIRTVFDDPAYQPLDRGVIVG